MLTLQPAEHYWRKSQRDHRDKNLIQAWNYEFLKYIIWSIFLSITQKVFWQFPFGIRASCFRIFGSFQVIVCSGVFHSGHL